MDCGKVGHRLKSMHQITHRGITGRRIFSGVDHDVEIFEVAELFEPLVEPDHEWSLGADQVIGIRVEDEIGRRVPGGGGRHQGGDQQHSPRVIHDDRGDAVGGSFA